MILFGYSFQKFRSNYLAQSLDLYQLQKSDIKILNIFQRDNLRMLVSLSLSFFVRFTLLSLKYLTVLGKIFRIMFCWGTFEVTWRELSNVEGYLAGMRRIFIRSWHNTAPSTLLMIFLHIAALSLHITSSYSSALLYTLHITARYSFTLLMISLNITYA